MNAYQLVGGILKKLFDYGNSDAASSSSPTQVDDSSSSSFPSSEWDYEVFLSFRGDDTRTNFTDHLYYALVNRGIHTFRDNEGLRIGENIDPALRSAIHQSKIAIPIFSKDYASSKWCLRELAEIVECMKQQGQRQITVMPVFYHVDPSDVRHHTGSYEKAFQNHQKKFDQETVKGWKKALKEVGALKGWEPKNIANGHEGKLIQLIVKEVWSELRKSPLIISDNLIGIHSHVEEMKKFLNIGSDDDIRIVGILGLGGIGKTTIARCVYNTIHHHFEGCSFLADARETFQTRGPVHLQCQLLINILNLENPNITNIDQGIDMIRQRLSNKKVLIVVDDVDQNIDLNKILGKREWFGNGSRIIITTRDRNILNVLGVDRIYEPNEMDSDHSLLLFSKHAFKRDQPPEQYLDLSKDVIEIARGLPLALEVLGSFLVDKGESAWKDTVNKLKKIPNDKVMEKLRISYDGLDRVQKEMFLDIACFFIGIDKDIACYVWDGCGFFPKEGIEVLQLKSLIKIDENNELRMHDQLRDVGREIVCQENPTNPEERSRLWSQSMVLDVLSSQRGTSKVEGLFIDYGFREDLRSEGFASMTKLRLLKANNAKVAGNFMHSFSELRWLSWRGCPRRFTPTNLRKLVVLDLSHSRISENWMGWKYIKEAETLKVLNLSGCDQLSRTPDFSGNLHLEILIFQWCFNLVTIDESIGHLKRLVSLNMNNCRSLRCLPTSICELSSLKKLDLQSTKIGRFPEKIGCLEALREFKVSHLGVLGETLSAVWLPHSIRNWRNLKTLSADYCNIEEGETLDAIGSLSSLEFLSLVENPFHSLPATVSAFSLLQTLSVASCYNLQSLPSLSHLTNLEVLSLDGCESLTEIPATIDALTMLKSLDLHRCHALQYIPVLPSGLTNLDIGDCENLKEISAGSSNMRNLVQLCVNKCFHLAKIEGLEGLYSLEKFFIRACIRLTKIPNLSYSKNLMCIEIKDCDELSEIEELKGLYSVDELTIAGCYSLRKIPNLSDLKNLVSMKIAYCESIERLPDLSNLTKLRELCIHKCGKLTEIQEVDRLENLKRLRLGGCIFIETLPCPSNLRNLRNLSVTDCKKLTEIQGVDKLESLTDLCIDGCMSIEALPCLSNLRNLRNLSITNCKKLTEIQGVDKLESLTDLRIDGCISIEALPCLSNLKKLQNLSVVDCKKLTEIQGVDELESLEKLIVGGCVSLKLEAFDDRNSNESSSSRMSHGELEIMDDDSFVTCCRT